MTLVIGGLAGLVVPPSFSRTGLTPLERTLAQSILPVLLVAFVVALVALSVSLSGSPTASRRIALVSLILINVAGLFSGLFGVEGAGLVATLVITAPLLAIIAQREVAASSSKRPTVGG